jgi:hypothetical protein
MVNGVRYMVLHVKFQPTSPLPPLWFFLSKEFDVFLWLWVKRRS